MRMHGFEVRCKAGLSDLLYNDEAHEEDKAALYQLGPFNNKDLENVLLIDEFPNTGSVSSPFACPEKEEIRNREEEMRDAQAQSYLFNAQFWWDPPKQWGNTLPISTSLLWLVSGTI